LVPVGGLVADRPVCGIRLPKRRARKLSFVGALSSPLCGERIVGIVNGSSAQEGNP